MVRPCRSRPHELLGELLLDGADARQAEVEFQASLKRASNRALGPLGLARALAASGESEVARVTCTKLLGIGKAADPGLPALAEARRAVSATPGG